jgi:hypothetical protein
VVETNRWVYVDSDGFGGVEKKICHARSCYDGRDVGDSPPVDVTITGRCPVARVMESGAKDPEKIRPGDQGRLEKERCMKGSPDTQKERQVRTKSRGETEGIEVAGWRVSRRRKRFKDRR